MASVINTDIYNITEITEDVKAKFIDEDDDTLAISTLGYISAIQADSMREAIRVTAKMGNEAIYSKATLQSSIITHAMILGVDGVFATPGVIKAKLVLNEADINKIMAANNSNKIIIDHLWKIMIDDFEYHLDYDIILTRTTISGNKNVYSAKYDTTIKNKLSDISNPYIDPPNTLLLEGATAIAFNVVLRQTYYNKMISNNVIDNKTFIFEYENQLCNFTIKVVKNGVTTYIEPVYEGTDTNSTIYCNYSFITTNKIRVKFDREVYIPELNSEITVEIFTTSGEESNFTYNANFNSFMESENYDYQNANALFMPMTDSMGGANQKTSAQLQAELPIAASARGSIGNTDDLTNYFNSQNSDSSRIIFKERTNNQFENTYYSYITLKDENNNMIPTNTITVKAPLDQFNAVNGNSNTPYRRYILNQGCYILSDGKTAEAVLNPTYKQLKEAKFIYTLPFTCAITDTQLQTSYYMSMSNDEYTLTYDYINNDSSIQFVTTNIKWERKYTENSNIYNLSFQLTQNITSDLGMITETKVKDEEGNDTDEVESYSTKLKVIIVLYKDGLAYRYKVADLKEYDLDNFTFQFDADFESSDLIDEDNNIRIENVNIIGQDEETFDYGYFEANTQVKIYVMYQGDMEYGRYNIDDYVPGLFGYSVSNMYSIDGGVYFFRNYSNSISSMVDAAQLYRNIENDMNWDIDPAKDKNMYIENGLLNIPYIINNGTTVTLTVINKNKNVIYKEEYVSDDTNEDAKFVWSMRDFSSLKNKAIEGLNFDSDGNYVFHEGDEANETIIAINNSSSKIVPENEFLTIRIECDGNYFTLEHTVTSSDLSAVFNTTLSNQLDYNIADYTTPTYTTTKVDGYILSSVPVIKRSYLSTEDKVQYVVTMLNKKKQFIEQSNSILESPFSIDFKFVNTYGPSRMYTTKTGKFLDRVNMSFDFNIKLKPNADKNVVEYIKDDIKKLIESINKDIDDIHMRVIEDTIQDMYDNAVLYVECMKVNDYDQTITHFYLTDIQSNSDIPEFICVNMSDNDETEPDINITLV